VRLAIQLLIVLGVVTEAVIVVEGSVDPQHALEPVLGVATLTLLPGLGLLFLPRVGGSPAQNRVALTLLYAAGVNFFLAATHFFDYSDARIDRDLGLIAMRTASKVAGEARSGYPETWRDALLITKVLRNNEGRLKKSELILTAFADPYLELKYANPNERREARERLYTKVDIDVFEAELTLSRLERGQRNAHRTFYAGIACTFVALALYALSYFRMPGGSDRGMQVDAART